MVPTAFSAAPHHANPPGDPGQRMSPRSRVYGASRVAEVHGPI